MDCLKKPVLYAVPQRLGVRLSPPALLIEWEESSSGQLFNRQVDFQNLLPTTDAVELADQVREANPDLLEAKVSPRQLVSLVSRLTQCIPPLPPSIVMPEKRERTRSASPAKTDSTRAPSLSRSLSSTPGGTGHSRSSPSTPAKSGRTRFLSEDLFDWPSRSDGTLLPSPARCRTLSLRSPTAVEGTLFPSPSKMEKMNLLSPAKSDRTLLPADMKERFGAVRNGQQLSPKASLECPHGLSRPATKPPSICKASFIREHAGNLLLDFYDSEGQKLGRGSYGTVSKAKCKFTGRVYAVKTVQKVKEQSLKRCYREVQLMKDADHPNIIKLHEIFEDHCNLYLIVEYCAGGELLDRIVEQGNLNEGHAARVMQQLLRAVHYLHTSAICHRDLKPQNLLLKSRESLDKATLKLIDFGVSRRFDPGTKLSSRVGSPYYIAPEVLEGSYTELCDMWSCGVILFLLLSGHRPFTAKKEEELFKNIRKGVFSFSAESWSDVSEDGKDLVRMLLKRSTEDRYAADQALNHNWVMHQAPRAQTALLKESLIQNLREFQAMNHLKKSALHVIAGQLDEEQIRDLRAIFEQLDTNQDGILTIAEYRDGLAKAGMKVTPDLQEVIQAIDLNRNDVIDYVEFLASALDERRYLQEDLCWSAFKVFDRDGNGRISSAELASVLQNGSAEKVLGSAAIQAAISQVDTNGDGEIDFKEFMAMMRSNPKGDACKVVGV